MNYGQIVNMQMSSTKTSFNNHIDAQLPIYNREHWKTEKVDRRVLKRWKTSNNSTTSSRSCRTIVYANENVRVEVSISQLHSNEHVNDMREPILFGPPMPAGRANKKGQLAC